RVYYARHHTIAPRGRRAEMVRSGWRYEHQVVLPRRRVECVGPSEIRLGLGNLASMRVIQLDNYARDAGFSQVLDAIIVGIQENRSDDCGTFNGRLQGRELRQEILGQGTQLWSTQVIRIEETKRLGNLLLDAGD